MLQLNITSGSKVNRRERKKTGDTGKNLNKQFLKESTMP